MTIRVFLVDDQELVRTGCAMVIDAQADMAVAGEAADGSAALSRLSAETADVLLVDVRMPRMDGVEFTERLHRRDGPVPKVIILTTFDLDEYAFAALRAGASGFLLKDGPAEEMLQAIRTVHRGDAVIAPSTTRRLISHVAPGLPKPGGDVLTALTCREREVLLLVARGASNAEIGAELFLSEGTVKTHVGRILHKLGLRDRIHAVVWAYENGVLRPGQDR
ncbi:response regulator transcription factor [Saccharopolyspora shandongensis]|uniref:response regulator transcription factor n=1 Tax=Saccharopolyspora shandongensis TaxID=418495 RepID=UPI0033F9050D